LGTVDLCRDQAPTTALLHRRGRAAQQVHRASPVPPAARRVILWGPPVLAAASERDS
jgi:hypothetical protein